MTTKRISCFSYKGGAGRSTLAMNILPFLADKLNASPERPIVLVDMDIDSCGVTYWLGLENSKYIETCSVQAQFGVGNALEADSSATSALDHRLLSKLEPVGDKFGLAEKRSVLCLPANPGASLAVGDECNYNIERNDNLKIFVNECKRLQVPAILFDSAVGDQLSANWSNEMANYIICCMRPTKQFREGTRRFFDTFDENFKNKQVIVVPNVVPQNELELLEGTARRFYPEYAKNEIFDSFFEKRERGDNKYILDLLNGDIFGVPQVPRFMWQEDILFRIESSELGDEEIAAIEKYKQIVDIICNGSNGDKY